jgi:mono/diheme cytochrome c family protein
MKRFTLLAFVLTVAAPPVVAQDRASGQAEAEHDVYRDTVLPLLTQHCVKCHGPQKQEGTLAVHTLDGSSLKGKKSDVEKWQAVRDKLILSEMPPDSQPRPDAVAVQRVVA